jgi:hypothetical protein
MRSISPFTIQASRVLCSPLVTHIHLLYQTTECRAITSEEGLEPGYITMRFIVRKITLELEHAILTTLYLVSAKTPTLTLTLVTCLSR